VVAAEANRVQEVLGEHLAPLNEETTFCALACVEQRALGRLLEGTGKSAEAMEQSIEAAVTGGEERQRAAGVLTALDRAIARLGVGVDAPHKTPGPLKSARDRAHEIESQLEQARAEADAVAAARQQEAEAEARLSALQEEGRQKQEVLEAYTRAAELTREKGQAEGREAECEARLKRLEAVEAKQRAAQSAWAKVERGALLSEEVLGEMMGLGMQVGQAQATSARLQGEIAAAKSRPGFPQAALAAVLFALGAAFLFLTRGPRPALFAGVLGGACAVLALVLWALRNRKLGLLRRELSRLSGEHEQAQRTLRQRMAQLGYQSVEEALSVRQQFEQAQQELVKVEGERRGILGEDTKEGLEGKRDEAARARRDAQEPLERDPLLISAREMNAEQVVSLRDRLGELGQALDEERARLVEARTKREQLGNAPDRLAALEADLVLAQRQREAVERQYEMRVRLKEMLSGVVKEFDARWKPRVAERVAQLLSAMTRGRYQRIESGEGIDFKAFPPESQGEAVCPAELSHSTKEQLYLAARVALLEQMGAGNPPPLILDDPFASFDAERRAAAATMCKHLSQSHQVILFTWSEEYDALADQVNVLPPPTPGQLP